MPIKVKAQMKINGNDPSRRPEHSHMSIVSAISV